MYVYCYGRVKLLNYFTMRLKWKGDPWIASRENPLQSISGMKIFTKDTLREQSFLYDINEPSWLHLALK